LTAGGGSVGENKNDFSLGKALRGTGVKGSRAPGASSNKLAHWEPPAMGSGGPPPGLPKTGGAGMLPREPVARRPREGPYGGDRRRGPNPDRKPSRGGRAHLKGLCALLRGRGNKPGLGPAGSVPKGGGPFTNDYDRFLVRSALLSGLSTWAGPGQFPAAMGWAGGETGRNPARGLIPRIPGRCQC